MKKIFLVILGIAFVIIPYLKLVSTLSLFCVMMLGGAVLYLLKRLTSNDSKILRQLFVLLSFLLFVALLEIISKNFEVSHFIKTIVFPVAIILGFLYYLRSRNLLDFFLLTILTLVAFSALIAVLQAIGIDAAWKLRLLLGVPKDEIVLAQINEMIKPSGLAYFSVQLSYQMIIAFPFVYYLRDKGSRINRQFVNLLGGCIFAGALATISVASILVIIITHLFYLKINRGALGTRRIVMVTSLLCIAGLIFTRFGLFDRILHPDASMLSRIPFFLMGIGILFTHPFGVASSELYNLKMQWLNNDALATLPGANWILNTSFHNSFVNTGISYGVIAIFIYISIYLYLFRVIKKDSRKNRYVWSNASMFYFSLSASLLGYLFQSSVHNAGLPSGDIFGWVLVGLVIVNKSILVKQMNIKLNKRQFESEDISK